MTWINDFAKTTFGSLLLPTVDAITDRVNQIFAQPTEDMISDLSYNAPEGDTSVPYREFADRYLRTKSHDYTGPESLDLPFVEDFEKEGRYAPWQKVLPGGTWDLDRVERRPTESIAAELAEIDAAIQTEAGRIRTAKFFEMIITGNSGLGGITPIDRKTLYSSAITQLRAPEKPPFSNILTPTVSNVTNPTIQDAYILAKAAEAHYATVDSDERDAFIDPEAVRQGLYFVTTSNGWYQAFRDLQTRETLAVNDANPATNASVFSNEYAGAITVRHARNQTGKAWEPWVRCFYVGPRSDDRPIIMAPDLGARPYRLDKSEFNVTVGFLLSWYTVAWKSETAILFQPTT